MKGVFLVIGYAKGGDVWYFIIALQVIKTWTIHMGIVFSRPPLVCRLCGGGWRGRTEIIGVWCCCHFVCFTVTLLLLFCFNSSCKGLSIIFYRKSISIFSFTIYIRISFLLLNEMWRPLCYTITTLLFFTSLCQPFASACFKLGAEC